MANICHYYEKELGPAPFTPDARNLVLNDYGRTMLRAWLVAKGVDSKRTMYASNDVMRAAYSNQNYLAKMIRGGSATSSKTANQWVDDSVNLDDLDAENTINDAIQPSTVEPPTAPSQSIDTASIARAADKVLGDRLRAALTELEQHNKMLYEKNFQQLSAEIQTTTAKIAQETVESVAQAIIEKLMPPREIVVTNALRATSINVGLQHQDFDLLLRAVTCRDHKGHRLNIWMTGPTGSGKTTAAENVAKALEDSFTNYKRDDSGKWEIFEADGTLADLNGLGHDAPFGADSSLDADYKVVGYKDANGTFHWTTFLRIFCYGGVYVMDEIDNWSPSALVAANAALANGWMSTPIGIIRRHPDCCIIAAANTWGYGATNDYVGRNKLDAATINRFPTKIEWPIDPKLEAAIATRMAGEIGRLWCHVVQTARQTAWETGLEVIYSPRNTFDGISLLQAGFDLDRVLQMNIYAGLDDDQKKTVQRKLETTKLKSTLNSTVDESVSIDDLEPISADSYITGKSRSF